MSVMVTERWVLWSLNVSVKATECECYVTERWVLWSLNVSVKATECECYGH